MRHFVEILAIAPVLEKCDIRDQIGIRKVSIKVDYAIGAKLGSIAVFDNYYREIHCRETDKKEDINLMKIECNDKAEDSKCNYLKLNDLVAHSGSIQSFLDEIMEKLDSALQGKPL